jgi:hypothetical protein
VTHILAAYRLAKFYGRGPDEFLAMPLSRITTHLRWTDKLIETSTPPPAPEEEPDG